MTVRCCVSACSTQNKTLVFTHNNGYTLQSGRTALHFACERGHVDMALLLLCEHAQVNVPDVVRLGGAAWGITV